MFAPKLVCKCVHPLFVKMFGPAPCGKMLNPLFPSVKIFDLYSLPQQMMIQNGDKRAKRRKEKATKNVKT